MEVQIFGIRKSADTRKALRFFAERRIAPLVDGWDKGTSTMAADDLIGEYRELGPGPVEEMIFFDHPSGRNRILQAMGWKAEHLPPGPGVPPPG